MIDEKLIKDALRKALAELGLDLKEEDVEVRPSEGLSHGDFSSNAALRFASRLGLSSLDLAAKLKGRISLEGLGKIEVAGPGFLNFHISEKALAPIVGKIIEEGEDYGRGEAKPERINLEFVSANPTGDLHLGHARCAALGDSVARIMEFAGWKVTREFYVNDSGNQVRNLGLSIRARYHALFGEKDYPFPEDGYHARDIISIAEELKREHGDKYLADSEENLSFLIAYGIQRELARIKSDLALFRVRFDVYSSEKALRENDGVGRVLREKYAEWLYEKDGATYLRTSAFGDDKDRVVIKSDGSYTYLAPDIAYHLDKLARGYDRLIDILGADHHGYLKRLRGALVMQGHPESVISFILVQIVRLMQGGQELIMSKRTGTGVSLHELCDLAGVDAVRYFLVERAPSSHLDFDLDLALKRNEKNPVYYAQYAYARLNSVLSLRGDLEPDPEAASFAAPEERRLIVCLAEFPTLIDNAAREMAPHLLAGYAQRLAQLVHGFYHACRIINAGEPERSRARLALVKAAEIVMKKTLGLLGVSAPEKM